MSITKEAFGRTKSGAEVMLFSLKNASGAFVEALDYGATLRRIVVPDKDNCFTDIALFHPTIADYEAGEDFRGAVVGRCANRIGGAVISIGDKEFRLTANAGENQLHGGICGFDKRIWCSEVRGEALVLTLHSPDGEEGYPGNVDAQVTYTFNDENELHIHFSAKTDQDTIINLANHAYFNPSGADGRSAEGLLLQVFADEYLPMGRGSVPTGTLEAVAGTPFDFREAKPLGWDWDAKHPQIEMGEGFDHNFVLRAAPQSGTNHMRPAAVLRSPTTGIRVCVSTTQPGLQVYSGNSLAPNRRSAVALETQGFPDSVHHANFPSVRLNVGQQYEEMVIFRLDRY